MKMLETDSPTAVRDAAERFNVCERTICRIGHTLGDLVSRDYSVHISEEHCKLRVDYSESQLGTDHSKKAWFDHTLLGSTRTTKKKKSVEREKLNKTCTPC